MDEATRLGQKILSLRKARGWSLQQVADLAGCTKSHVWEIEHGRSKNPTLGMLVGFATAFGVPLSHLVGATDKPRVPAHLAEAISSVQAIWQQAWQAGYDAALAEVERMEREG